MYSQSETIRQSELLQRLVLDRETAESIGKVEQLWLDTQSHRLLGLTAKAGFLGRKRHRFSWSQVENIGKDGVLVTPSGSDSEPEFPEAIASLSGHELWTDNGDKIGYLVDYIFQPKSGTVVGYLFRYQDGEETYFLEPVALSSIGKKRAIVLDKSVKTARRYEPDTSENLEAKPQQTSRKQSDRSQGTVSKVKGFFQEDLAKTEDDLRSIGHKLGLTQRGDRDESSPASDTSQDSTRERR